MFVRVFALLASVSLLASCGADDPENTPLRGEWESVVAIESVRFDGIRFEPDELPDNIRSMERTERVCGEPYYTNGDWYAEDVLRRTDGMCDIAEYQVDDDSAEFSGTCEITNGGGSFSPRVNGSSRFTETTARDVITMEGDVALPNDSGPHVMKITAVRESTRIGDC